MNNIQLEGDSIRKAVLWISQQRKKEPVKKPFELAKLAGLKFDLTPVENEFIFKFVQNPDIEHGQ